MANINATKFLPGSTATEPEKKTRAKPTIIPKRDLIVIRNRVIKVRDLVKNTTLLSEKETERKRIATEEEKFDKQEKKLEEKPDEKGEDKKSKIPGLPKLGFFDRIKNFFFNVLLGYVAIKLLPHINKLPDIVGKIGSAIDFGTDLALGLFNGLASFIDWGYKAYDATRGFLKSFGGDNVVKLFDGFGDAVNKVIDATIIAALALTSLGGDDGFGGGAGKRGFDKSGRRVGKNLQERYARRFGREQFLERFGRRNLRNLSGGMRGGVRGTAKSILGFVRPLLKRIPLPVVGALIDFGLSVALGEPLGKAAFKSIGAGLAGFIGAAIGSIPVLIPFGGPLIGGILGGMAGDALGSALYDMFFGGKKPKPQKTTKAATGGQVTRGGKPVGGTVTRTIKKAKRTVKIQPTKVKPGASVGGEEKIKKIFPEVKTGDKGKKVDTLGYMKSSYDKSSSIPGFGGLFGIHSKAQLGQKPSDLDYQNAAAGLNAWMQRTFSSEIMRTGGAFAEGGSVDVGMFGSGEDMTNMIAKSLEDNISPRMNDIFNDLQKQLMLEKGEDEKKGKEGITTQETSGSGEYSPEGLQGEIYQYLLSKGMDDIHAIGLMANISRESEFRPGVDEIGGGGGVGLFQYTSQPRKGNFLKAVPDYKTNWKGQIDYALKEPGEPGPQWLAMKFSSSQEAADWFMKEWERPEDEIGGSQKHKEYIKSLEKYKSKTGKGYNLPSGDLGSKGDGSFIQGNSGRSGGTHFHIGTNKPGDGSGVATAGFSVIKHFLGKKSIHVGRSFEDIPANAKDNEIQGYIRRGQAAHRQTELDLQIGGIGAGNKVPFPLALKGLKYSSTDGYGVSADIVGTNAFVGHGRYKPDGTLAAQQKLVLNTGAPDFYAFHGMNKIITKDSLLKVHKGEYVSVTDADSFKLVGNILTDINSIENKSQLVALAPSIIEKLKTISGYAGYETGAEEVIEVVIPQSQMVPLPIPMPSGIGGFGGMSGGSSDSSYDSLYAGS
jgi:hypothetical protein